MNRRSFFASLFAAVLGAIGIRPAGKLWYFSGFSFRIRNSWGKGWGKARSVPISGAYCWAPLGHAATMAIQGRSERDKVTHTPAGDGAN